MSNDDKDNLIDTIWGNSGHGTRREDIDAAFEAGSAFVLGKIQLILREIEEEQNKAKP